MKILPIETSRILKNKKKLEARLNVKLSKRGKDIVIEGKEEDEYIADKVLEAINFGFKLEQALLLKDENYVFEEIYIKNLTKRKDLHRIRARIIGKNGMTKKNIENLSNCLICLKDNVVGIIGQTEDIRQGINAITNLIQGSKQGSVYGFLERCKKNFQKA